MHHGSTILSFSDLVKDESKAPFVFERRAASILFNIIKANPVDGPFLLPANVCPIVPLVLYKAKRAFEFIDISLQTFCMDHDAIIARWLKPGKRPAGIIYVRSYGAILDTSNVFSIVKTLSPNAMIIDDRCLCPPDFSRFLPSNTNAVLYSTGYGKYADIGFGGYSVVSADLPYIRCDLPFSPNDLDEVVRQYKRSLFSRSKFIYKDSDWLDTTPPDITWSSYQSLVEQECGRALSIKSSINSIYAAGISPNMQLAQLFQWWRFNMLVDNSSDVLDAIKSKGFFASGHYDSLAGLFGPGDAPNAEKLHKKVINLFNDRYFDVEKAKALTSFLASLNLSYSGRLFK